MCTIIIDCLFRLLLLKNTANKWRPNERKCSRKLGQRNKKNFVKWRSEEKPLSWQTTSDEKLSRKRTWYV